MNRSFIRSLTSKVKSAVKVPHSEHLHGQNKFERNFPVFQRKKAWERDGMDKDEWFRKKYAHVHAREASRKRDAHTETSKTPQVRKRAAAPVGDAQPRRSSFKSRHAFDPLTPDPLLDRIYGRNSILLALQSNRREYFVRLLHSGNLDPQIAKLAGQLGIKVQSAQRHQLNMMTNNAVHNGLVLEAKPLYPQEINALGAVDHEAGTFELIDQWSNNGTAQKVPFLQSAKKRYPVGLYLDEVVDPHNVGAILRSAYFLGADFVAVSHRNSAPLSAAVSKTSSGALEVLPIYSVDKPLQFFERSRDEHDWVFVASHLTQGPGISSHVKNRVLPIEDMADLAQSSPVMLVVGNEGTGIRSNLQQRSDFFVQVPFGRADEPQLVDSLNVSVAAALLLRSLLS
ncbi:ADL269Wp [Eremothecium gossypii ATCC 10895]|uniref:rRNA methyltransferase 1, mitochondrial n=1 Tax=Eremothecium gossypii (strain ATCC 10895 / CBS 109.51 / FGSC 9923 / NRRL Y-1056) TaxID=284811 RepID=Q75B46_EREGS|nr:ADL269Wp [Eremothecium gossypii ATCC 10895]AAS51651.1 ADL269Wp [Eremothecium gossypii ATCC 10895]AEY95947.1 FADL269Wp [Eremothecium gossypii FDAG1]